jgi:hypothetical protein
MDTKLNEPPKKIKIPKCLYASDEEISEDEADLIPCPPKDIITSTVPVEPIAIEKSVKKPIVKEQQITKIRCNHLPTKTSKYMCEYCCNYFKTQSAMLKHLHNDKCFFKNHEDKLTKEQLKNRDESLRLQLIELGKLQEDEPFGHAITPLKKILEKQKIQKKQPEEIKEELDDDLDDDINNDINEILKMSTKPVKEPKQKPVKEKPPPKPVKEKPPKPPKEPKPKQPRQPKEKTKVETFNPPPPPPQMQRQQSQQQPRYVFKFN